MISLIRAFPAMRKSLHVALSEAAQQEIGTGTLRTDQDLHPGIVVGGIVLLGLGLWLLPAFQLDLSPHYSRLGLPLSLSSCLLVWSDSLVRPHSQCLA